MDYEQYLKFCKDRALAYLDKGEVRTAFLSMASDLAKSDLTANRHKVTIHYCVLLSGADVAVEEARYFINEIK